LPTAPVTVTLRTTDRAHDGSCGRPAMPSVNTLSDGRIPTLLKLPSYVLRPGPERVSKTRSGPIGTIEEWPEPSWAVGASSVAAPVGSVTVSGLNWNGLRVSYTWKPPNTRNCLQPACTNTSITWRIEVGVATPAGPPLNALTAHIILGCAPNWATMLAPKSP